MGFSPPPLPSRGFSITDSCHLLIHTCYFGDALQFRDWKSDNEALGSAHPQQPLANEETRDSHALLTCGMENIDRKIEFSSPSSGQKNASRLRGPREIIDTPTVTERAIHLGG